MIIGSVFAAFFTCKTERQDRGYSAIPPLLCQCGR